MYTCPIQLKDVRYNAATQRFEASVTVRDNTINRTYACDIAAPITMSFDEVSRGLAKQAIRRHQHRGGLFSQTDGSHPRLRAKRKVFDPIRWLDGLITGPDRSAA